MISAVAELVRRHDRDRFATALFVAANRREDLLTLYAFNYEIARIRETVSEPLLGSMRLQWWRDVIVAAREGKVPQHEVAGPLARLVSDDKIWDVPLVRMLDAREADLLPEPPETLQALEDYAKATAGNLAIASLAFFDLGPDEDPDGKYEDPVVVVARHIGAAYGLAGLLRGAVFLTRAGRQVLPRNLDPGRRLSELKPHAELAAAARTIANAARAQLDHARRIRHPLPRSAMPLTLQGALAVHWLRLLEKVGYDLFDPRLAAPDPWRAMRLWFAAKRNRY